MDAVVVGEQDSHSRPCPPALPGAKGLLERIADSRDGGAAALSSWATAAFRHSRDCGRGRRPALQTRPLAAFGKRSALGWWRRTHRACCAMVDAGLAAHGHG